MLLFGPGLTLIVVGSLLALQSPVAVQIILMSVGSTGKYYSNRTDIFDLLQVLKNLLYTAATKPYILDNTYGRFCAANESAHSSSKFWFQCDLIDFIM